MKGQGSGVWGPGSGLHPPKYEDGMDAVRAGVDAVRHVVYIEVT